MFVPTWVGSSRTMTPPDTWGGVLVVASPKLAGGCSVVRCLFQERLGAGGGGVESLPLGSCYCEAGRASGTKRPMVIIRLVTISSPGSDSAPKELADSVAASLTTWTKASGLTGTWTLWFCDISSAEVSFTGTSSSEAVYRGPRSWASPTVSCGGRKLAWRTSIYDNNGLSTNKAGLNGCQVV